MLRLFYRLIAGKVKPYRELLLKTQHITMLFIHFCIFFKVYKKSYKLLLILLCIVVIPNYVYTKYLKYKGQNKKIIISFYTRIFCFITYFQLILNVFSRGDIYIFTWLEKKVGLSYFMISILEELIMPTVITYRKLMEKRGEYLFYFEYFFNFFYVARNSAQFTYFTRYHYMYAYLVKVIIVATTSILPKWHAVEHSTFIKNRITTDIVLILFLFIGYGLINLSFGKQPKLIFFDKSIEYHIGKRKKIGTKK